MNLRVLALVRLLRNTIVSEVAGVQRSPLVATRREGGLPRCFAMLDLNQAARVNHPSQLVQLRVASLSSKSALLEDQ